VSQRHPMRTQRCAEADAATRLRHAHRFIDVAELAAEEGEPGEYASPAAALAVLAGIAACDASCCKALGWRSRGQDHRAAVELMEEIEPGGRKAAQSLTRLLGFKDAAHYGFRDIGGQNLKSALRQARDLIAFAEAVMQR